MIQAATLPIDVGGALSLQDSVIAWQDDRLPDGNGQLSAEKAERLRMLVLRAVQMAIGLKIVWPVCTQEGSVWETDAYVPRVQAVELLARIVVNVLTRTKQIVAQALTAHPEWVAPREVAELQADLPIAQEILKKSQELSAWLNRKRPPVNEEMIRRSQESLSRGEGELLRDVIARLKDCGSPVKE